MKMMLPDVIGHENQSQHYPDHRYLCLEFSGHITTPDRFSYHTGKSPISQYFKLTQAHRVSYKWKAPEDTAVYLSRQKVSN